MKILFYDTETTGLPGHDVQGCGYTHSLNGQPRPIQIGWIVTDETGNILKTRNRFILPKDFSVPERVSLFNGITTDYLKESGEDEKIVLDDFLNDVFTSDFEVGHNVLFDKNVILARLADLGRKRDYAMFFNHKAVCTMKGSYAWCGLHKSPKLMELHKMLFCREFDNAHDAMADITATKDCYFEMLKHNIMTFPR